MLFCNSCYHSQTVLFPTQKKHASGTQLAQTSTHLAQTGTQLAHLTALATEVVSTGADARVGTHTN